MNKIIVDCATGAVESVPLTAEEIAERQNVPAPNPLEKIVAIEAANPVTHRMLRDLTLAVAQIASAVTGKAPEENKAVRDIQELEAEIAVLRQQAKAQGLIP
jgi:hypothetical protein